MKEPRHLFDRKIPFISIILSRLFLLIEKIMFRSSHSSIDLQKLIDVLVCKRDINTYPECCLQMLCLCVPVCSLWQCIGVWDSVPYWSKTCLLSLFFGCFCMNHAYCEVLHENGGSHGLFFCSFVLAVWVVLQHHFVSTALGSYSLSSTCILFFKTWDVN
jgi:hypothetical protein